MYHNIAIIGLAFRFPGDLSDEQVFWDALVRNENFVGSVPSERWAVEELRHAKRAEPGRSVTFSAGVLSRVDEFDAHFFGISPREARMLDPQQRLLLELAWEAMENGYILPSSLAGSDCAVYVGISGMDYGTRCMDDMAVMTSHSMTGNAPSIASNRLSYAFDLRGPSLSIDTACSSSLVALHHACTCLRSGGASAALVGGVNMLLHPSPFVGFTKASMLSADGRCKAFDASGDGYVRAEGGAVLLLKPLDKALADGNSIKAVILGSGVNSDGARTSGLTIPSVEGQVELLSDVLAQSGLEPDDIDFIEAHGTGTAVGDPVEAAAIGRVYGQGRRSPLPVGSVKTNLGHLESASGMAGLVKALLCLRNHELPPSLHLKTPNPAIDFAGLNIEVTTRRMPLGAEGGKPLVAGVNSFGFGGTNAHVLLQEFRREDPAPVEGAEASCPPLFLSARTEAALRDMAGRYAACLEPTSAAHFYDVARAASSGRERLEKRLALAADSPQEAVHDLAGYAEGGSPERIFVEDALPDVGGVAFVYSGNGAQWLGMARALLAKSQRFAGILADIDAQVQRLAGFSILKELLADEADARLHDTVVAQPMLFAIQVGVTTLLEDLGVKPQGVAGHSVGEVAAAWAAGALTLEQAVRVIVFRSAAQGATHGLGKMAAASISRDAAQNVLSGFGDALDVTIAAVNSPHMVTFAGSVDDMTVLGERFKSGNVHFKLLDLDYAFHSRHMDSVRDSLIRNLGDLVPSPCGKAVFVSAVSGDVLDGSALDAGYWWRNVRETVNFEAAVAALAATGCRVFVEIGPHAILQRYMRDTLASLDVKGRVLPTLRKNADGLERVVEAALRVHLIADSLPRDVFFPHAGRDVRLPSYPWQHERFWHPVSSESLGSIDRRRVHPLLGWPLPGQDHVWENVLDPVVLPWLGDHKVGGAVVFPGTAYAEMGLAAARRWLGDGVLALEELDILSPMVFDGEHARTLQLALDPSDGGFRIRSRQRLSDDPWTLHATGRVIGVESGISVPLLPDVSSPADCIACADHYRMAAGLGLDYGPAFQGLDRALVDGDTLTGVLRSDMPELGDGYLIHPAQTDVCAQSLLDFYWDAIAAGEGVTLLPVRTGRLLLLRRGCAAAFRTRLRRRGVRSVLADFDLLDAAGEVMAVMRDCRFRAAPLARRDASRSASWRVVPRLSPHPGDESESPMPPVEEIMTWCRASLEGLEPQRRAWFEEALPLLEALVLAMAREGFERLAAEASSASPSPEELSSPYGRWLRGLLQREGMLRFHDGSWLPAEAPDLPAAAEIWRTLLRDFPACLPQLALLGRVGLHLPSLLAEPGLHRDFLESLQAAPVAESYYADPAYLGVGTALAGALNGIAAGLPAGRRLRVLEVAAGADDLMRERCRILPEDRLDYVLAFADDRVLERRMAEFRDMPAVTLTSMDCAQWTLADESIRQQGFDVVILGHALHRAHAPRGALARVRSWLAPGGLLLAAERHPDWSADFLAGLDERRWFESLPDDTGRTEPLSPLRGPEDWQAALREEGFEDVASFTEPAAGRLAEGAYLVMGRRPSAAAPELSACASDVWLLLADDASADAADMVRADLEARGGKVTVAHPPRLGPLPEADHVVLLLGWRLPVEESENLLSETLSCVQEVAGRADSAPKLWIVTSGGALASGLPPGRERNPVQAALWGFGRVIMNELPALRCTLIDVEADAAADMGGRLAGELLSPDGTSEILLGGEGRHSLVLVEEDDAVANARGERFRLDFRVPGRLRNLLWLPDTEREPGADLVEVRTMAVGLNFRDVMYLMGLLPDEALEKGFAGPTLGLEFAGVVTRVGAAVRGLQPGDHVMGFGPACFSSHVVTPAHALMPMPEGWTFEAAATVPTVFLTSYYALKHLADLQPGERVLIHGGAGGVGMAAIQLARHLGAEVFATAGSDVKRDLVRLLGADHVFDSRSLSFADDILAATDGQGVDVVLNSLSGEAVRRNLRVLKPFGRFLELGKRDFFENTHIGLRPFKDNISYFGIDADQLLTGRPRLAARLLEEVMGLFRAGVLTPLPYSVFPAERVVDAFRCMQQARHMGKIVVSLDGTPPLVRRGAPETKPVRFAHDDTWLVTGGLAGFGLESARWLAARGAGNLVLLSRSGLGAPGAREAMEELATRGVKTLALACDVTDAASLAEALRQAAAELPPIRGVLHAAMVLDDRLIANLDAGSMSAVLRPKLLGAWNLHNLTSDLPIEHFVLYSSITTSIGNPGQANYVAANAGLEALAQLRRQAGLPATCVGWGPIGDAGYLTRNTAVRDSLAQRLGGAPLAAAEALERLAGKLGSDHVDAVANMDWEVLSRFLPSAGGSRFAVLNRRRTDVVKDDAGLDFRALAAEKSVEELTGMVRGLVLQEVAQILSLSVERIDPERPLHDLGMDSLMAVELALGLEKRFGVQFPVMLLNESPSSARVAGRIVERLTESKESGHDESALVGDIVRRHGEQVSAEDMARMARDAGAVHGREARA